MKRLDKKDYHKLIKPLKQVSINNLFARAVVEKKVSGEVYVDYIENPKTYYVVHPYGMSLLFGDPGNSEFNNEFLKHSMNITKERGKHIWMQAFPESWDSVLIRLYGENMLKSSENIHNTESGIIELNTRINFVFKTEKYRSFKLNNNFPDCKVVKTDESIYNAMQGSVIPSYFWDSAKDFFKNGIGFSILCNNKLAATAYSAFIHDNELEIGIETIPEFRGKGFAQVTCSALIDYCIENNFEPVWACRLENIGSFKLAQKLGFEVTAKIPYYRLSR